MEFSEALDLGRGALLMVLTLASPILAVGMVVGLAVALFQAVTQLQEQTLTFATKIVAMVLSGTFFVPWIAKRLLEYTQELLGTPPY